VTIACPGTVASAIAAGLTEATYLALPEDDGMIGGEGATVVRREAAAYDVLLVGPGLGQGAGPSRLVRELLLSPLPDDPRAVVVDADALNALAREPRWWEKFELPCVLTPHPGELARLAGLSVAEVQADRVAVSVRCSRLWEQVVVLKGAYTVVATPDGRAAVSPFANPALASAGTGDVLAGAIAGLIGQGLEPFEAAVCGVYLHARAAEAVCAELGDAGLLASDLLPALPRAIQSMRGAGSRKAAPRIDPLEMFLRQQ
jgi:NAD(P)H-hydrate epimerase